MDVPDQWHLTLAFSANVPDRSYDDLVARLTRAAAKRRPMQARIAGGGAFPNVGRAKVLFAGIETGLETGDDGEELRRAATGARAALAKAGAEVDGQRFRAHLTLARIGRPVEATKLGPAARRLRRSDLADRRARPRCLTPRGGPAATAAPRGGRDVQSRPRW